MSLYTCGKWAFGRKRKDQKLSKESKNKIAEKMNTLAVRWQRGDFKNVKDAGWNNFETFEWLWRKYTHKELDFAEFPANFKDVRKFEFGLNHYNKLIAKPQGLFASKFHLPQAAMQNIPELKRFETELINETSFFRDYSSETGKQVNEILEYFKKYTLEKGAGKFLSVAGMTGGAAKKIRTLQDRYDILVKKIQVATNPTEKIRLSGELRKNTEETKSFYETGAGEAFQDINSVLQGVDIESIPGLDNTQRSHLYKIKDNYVQIRRSGVKGLVRGLQKIKAMAKDKDLRWVDGTVDKLNSLIKDIEFQHVIDESGQVINFKDMQNERDFLKLGFKSSDPADRFASGGKVKLSKHYMSQYTLGILKTVKKLETAVENRDLSISDEIRNELNRWDSIIDRAKKKSPIINAVYDNDPYFFIRKYASDVGIFNYKAHVKSTFKKATDAIQMEHLDPAKEAGRVDLQESAESMLGVLKDVYKEIQHMDPAKEDSLSDMMRIMTSVTYFRLMGGNVRSALRNATQRLNEWTEFGVKASLIDANKFYKDSGMSNSNQDKLNRQLKKFGLQWFDGKTRRSNAWESLTGKRQVSQESRGALEDSYINDKELYVNSKGELTIKKEDRVTEKAARATGGIARFFGGAHRVVEDWNRGKTFRVAFALASENLASTNKSWMAKKILGKEGIAKIREVKGKDYDVGYNDLAAKYGSDTQKTIENWIETKAGQIAYNSTLDIHFEYAKWAKAKAIKDTSTSRSGIMGRLVGGAKVGLGQFAHYKFSMINLMNKWMKEGWRSYRAGDFTSEEALRPLRFGLIQAGIWISTIAGKTNFAKLAPNDVIEQGEAMWLWLASNREKLVEGEVSPETAKKLEKKTYGSGGYYFLGPNFQVVAGAYELFTHAQGSDSIVRDPRTQFSHEDNIVKSVRAEDSQEKYKKIALINSQAARTLSYTWPQIQGGGSIGDVIYLEAGLYPSKEQRRLYRDWIPWAKKRRPRKKLIKKSLSRRDRQSAIKALTGL